MPSVSQRWTQMWRIDRTSDACTLVMGELTGEPKADATDQHLIVVMATKPMTHGLIQSTPHTLEELHGLLSKGDVKVNRELKCIFEGWNRRCNANELQTVLAGQLVIVVRLPKRRRDKGKVETIEHRAFIAHGTVESVGDRLGVRWHYREADGSNVSVTRRQNTNGTRLTLLNVREAFSKELAR